MVLHPFKAYHDILLSHIRKLNISDYKDRSEWTLLDFGKSKHCAPPLILMTKQVQGKLSNPKQEVEMTRSRVNELFVPIWLLVDVLLSWLGWVSEVFKDLQCIAMK